MYYLYVSKRFRFNFPSCIPFDDCGSSLAIADSQVMSAFWTYVLSPKQSADFKRSKDIAMEKSCAGDTQSTQTRE